MSKVHDVASAANGALQRDQIQNDVTAEGALSKTVDPPVVVSLAADVNSLTLDEDEIEEEEDNFDVSLEPTIHHKKHATQETLDFIYHNSLSTSPSQPSGSYPLSPGHTGTTFPSKRSTGAKRRPSGVPPPPRELQPGDYLYQKNKSRNLEIIENDEEEEEEKEKEENKNVQRSTAL